MSNENKKENISKFNFVNQIEDKKSEEDIDKSVEKLEEDTYQSIIKKEENPTKKEKSKKRFDIFSIFGDKIHISFEMRVGISILFILVLFVWACVLILQALNFGRNMTVNYNEESNVNYKVCVNSVDYYPNTCLNEGMEYVTSITDKIKFNFQYLVDFSTDIDYDLSYNIEAITRIYDINNSKKILYENKETLVKNTKLQGINRKIELNKDIEIDFKESNAFVLNYKNNYALNSAASLEIIMYLNEPNETRKVASTVLPLGNATFGITKNTISNKDKVVEIDNNTWNEYNIMFAVIGCLLIIVALLILLRLTKLVLKVTTNRNEYQKKLAYILREYDRLIVIARNGFVTTREKAVTKVLDFDELMDARDALNRPIIYTKINDVKSEFIVEDDDRIYKYVMKESDFSNYE